MLQPVLHWLAVPFERLSRFANDLTGRVRRRRLPSRRQLVALKPDELERFLEERGIAGRVRVAMGDQETPAD